MTRAAITGFASFLRFWRIIFVLTKHETDSKKKTPKQSIHEKIII